MFDLSHTLRAWGRHILGLLALLIMLYTPSAIAANYTLTISKTGDGTGTVSSSPSGISCGSTCSKSYTNNTKVTLTAQPAADSVFTGWSGACSGSSSCIITLSANKQVKATFTPKLTSISSRKVRNCAIVDGGVQCWGLNEKPVGLGNGYATDSKVPVQAIPAKSGVTALSVGDLHTCAVLNKKQVQCWGYNYNKQLGDGTKTNRLRATLVTELLPAKIDDVAAGYDYTCILANQGVQCWGNAPAYPVPFGSGATQLSAGGDHACAVVNGGVFCWGSAYQGKLGGGVSGLKTYSVPVQAIPQGSGATEVSASQGDYTCAVVNGGVKCWGSNLSGQLGNNSTKTSTTPVQALPAGSGATHVSTGHDHTCAVAKGSVKCWGSHKNGKLGIGQVTSNQLKPVTLSSITGATAVTAGGLHTCAIVQNKAKCWGSNLSGQLGNTSVKNESYTPVSGPAF